MSENKYPIGGYAALPADDAVQNWFEENIDKECSASSAIYKFRLWLEALQPKPAGPVWVKDALKWSKEAIEFANKEFECPQHFVETWGNLYMNVLHAIDQALDEAPTLTNDQITAALRKFVSMHETGLLPNRFTYEEGKKALEEVGTNKDAIEFAEWCDDNYYRKYGVWRHRGNHEHYTTADLHQLWQQSKS